MMVSVNRVYAAVMVRFFTLTWCLAAAAAYAHEPPAAPAARAAVETALTEMRRAVLSGDAGSLLACIDPSEPRLAAEMCHWAEDLAKHHPFEFTVSIVNEGAEFDESRAVCGVTMTWRIALDENGREIAPDKAWERQATFPPVVFTRAPDGRWLWSGEDWLVLEGDGFTVNYLPGDEPVARQVRDAFPIARKHVNDGFDIVGTSPQTIKLYASMAHLKATVYLSMPDPVLGGWNEPGESIKFMLNYASNLQSWTRAFAHEYGHAATWEMGPHAKHLPWWMQEGVAELAAEEFDPGKGDHNQRQVRRYALGRGLAPWDKIAHYDTCEQPLKHLAYVQGHHFMGYISDRFGREKRNQWLRVLSTGRSLDEGSLEVLEVGFENLNESWRATLPMPAESKPPESPGEK